MDEKAPNENSGVRLLPVHGLPKVAPGNNLAALLLEPLQALSPEPGDVLVVAQKIVSKAENRYVNLAEVTPSERALDLAGRVRKDPRLVELILAQSKRVVRHRPEVLIVEHELGFIHANAGIDHSNIPQNDRAEMALLLPANPDASARRIHLALKQTLGIDLGIVINDSAGRPWRNGVVGIAIGAAGLPCLLDLRGQRDLYGNPLNTTEVGVADEIAAAASLVMGQAAQDIPAVLVKGLRLQGPSETAAALLRAPEKDLFR